MRRFVVYFTVNGNEIQEIPDLNVIEYNKFKDRHNVYGEKGALEIILQHLTKNNLYTNEEVSFIYKSIDMVDFDLIYCNKSQISFDKKFRILNTLKTYSFDYEINKYESQERFRDGRISDIPVDQYVEVKDDGCKFYPLLFNYFEKMNYEPIVDIETLHYSFDDVDYESCNLERGIFFVLFILLK